MGRCKACKKINSTLALNYRAEIIGGLLASRILPTLDSMIPQDAMDVQIDYDNLEAVHHSQTQAGLCPRNKHKATT